MTKMVQDSLSARWPSKGVTGFLHFAGFRYWSASLLPALLGTTLPFWLRPPGFSFRWLGAIEFLFATVLLHAGFSFLQAWFANKSTTKWSKSRFLRYAGMCIVLACLLGLHINSDLRLNKYVHENIFIIYGISVIFVGLLFVAPPVNFWRRPGGEIVISESLGLLPVLGAYIIQAGDITRTVYLASLPLVVVTGLWVWTEQLASRIDDEKVGRKTLLILFSPLFSGRYIVLALSMLLYTTLLLAVFTASISPWALVAVLSLGLVWMIVVVSWKEYASPMRMLKASRNAFRLHLVTGIIFAASSLAALLR